MGIGIRWAATPRRNALGLLAVGTLIAVGLGATWSVQLAAGGVRKPYLQNDRAGEVSLLWSDPAASSATVEYRPAGSRHIKFVTAQSDGGSFRVRLKGLTHGSLQEYRVTESGSKAGPWVRFRSEDTDAKSVRFAVFGDMGSGDAAEASIAKLLDRLAPDFAIAVGDLAYPKATPELLTRKFFNPLASYNSGHVVWPVWGNHDVAADQGRPLELATELPLQSADSSVGPHTYSFDRGPVHFTVLDSNSAAAVLRGQVEPWLRRDLAGAGDRWKLVFLHHPVFSSGHHGGAKRVVDVLKPVFEECGVSAVFSGHDHQYERFAPVKGVTYLVTGAGGGELETVVHPQPGSVSRNSSQHSVTIVAATHTALDIRQVAVGGAQLDQVRVSRPELKASGQPPAN